MVKKASKRNISKAIDNNNNKKMQKKAGSPNKKNDDEMGHGSHNFNINSEDSDKGNVTCEVPEIENMIKTYDNNSKMIESVTEKTLHKLVGKI